MSRKNAESGMRFRKCVTFGTWAGGLPSEAVRYMLPFGLYNNTGNQFHAAGVGRLRAR